MIRPKRVAIIGLDAAQPHLIEKHIAEGHLPTFKKLIEAGTVADNCLVAFPTVTPPNWATIATGAWPGTHGITDFHVAVPGATPSNANTVEAFSSDRCRAEYLWDAADKAGKKCIVLNYPGSWPSHLKNGIMVGGAGLTVTEKRDGLKDLKARLMVCHDQLITTGNYPAGIRGQFTAATAWQNAPDLGEAPQEMTARLSFPGALEPLAPATWYVLAWQSADAGYDRVTLSPSRDWNAAFCTLAVGEWSPKVVTRLLMADGSTTEVFFRVKLIELSEEGDELRLFVTALCATSGWSAPAGIAEMLVSAEGVPEPSAGLLGYPIGWYGLDTYMEINEIHDKWLADAAVTLLTTQEWDLFFIHSHPPDWMYHAVMTDMDPALCTDEERRAKAWETHLRVYQSQDRLLARVVEALGDDTLVVLVSDHGAVADGPMFDPYKALVPAGLTVLEAEGEGQGHGYAGKVLKASRTVPDPARSKCFPQREIYVYVNLKGRDPEGIVDPADYERVQHEIIDALLAYVDPETGRRPVCMALSKQDARILGLYGDGVGDVIYALYPWFGSQHGQALPTAEWGVGSLKGLLTFTGPGFRQGYRLERTVRLVDVVPTVCYAMDLPVPAETEGSVIYQAFKDPDFRSAEVRLLREELARMEMALSGTT